MAFESINAPCNPQFEGQLVKYTSPVNAEVTLLDEARRNEKHDCLEWWAVLPHQNEFAEKMAKATWA